MDPSEVVARRQVFTDIAAVYMAGVLQPSPERALNKAAWSLCKRAG